MPKSNKSIAAQTSKLIVEENANQLGLVIFNLLTIVAPLQEKELEGITALCNFYCSKAVVEVLDYLF